MGNLMRESNLDELLEKIQSEIRSGIKHGFFDFRIACETVKDKKRKVTVTTGKSYQFYIPEDEF